jgi:hypothetical protein
MSKVLFFADNTMTSLKEFTLEEFLDPRVNKIWQLSDDRRILSETYHKLTRQLFCKENLIAFPYQCIYQLNDYLLRNDRQAFCDHFLSAVNPELAWVFQYIYVWGIDRIDNNFSVLLKHPHFSSNTNVSNNLVKYEISDWTQVRVNKDNINELLSRLANSYQILFNSTVGRKTHRNYVEVYCQFGQHFRDFLFQLTVYTLSSGDGCRMLDLFGYGPEQMVYFNHPLDDITKKGLIFSLMLRQKITKTFRDPLYRVLSYSTQATNLIDWPILDKNEKNPVLYGVELECVSDYNVRQIIDAQAIPFFIAKSDGSISGSKRNATELVTVPMSLKAHKKHWAHWFRNIDYKQFDCTKDTTNGLHVHIDRKAFMNEQHLRNMVWFYTNPANTDFLLYISERGSLERMAQYSPIYQYPSSLSKVRAFKDCTRLVAGTRGIVNLSKTATVEVRMFRGIVSFGELVKDLEFVDAVFHFCEGEHSLNKLTFPDFLVWLSREPINKYTILRKFIDQCKNLPDMIIHSEVKSIVFNLSDPDTIVERLNKSKIKITNAHVTILNKGNKRKYILNKETGLIDVLQTNLSKFAKLDRVIESRYTRHAI